MNCNQTNTSNTKNWKYLVMNDIQTEACVDTGFSIYTICYNFYEEHIPLKLVADTQQIEWADGQILRYSAYNQCPQKVNGTDTELPVLIICEAYIQPKSWARQWQNYNGVRVA